MNSRISFQQLKGLFLIKGLFALLLATTGRASAADTIDIKDTNYEIPAGAYFVSPDGKDTNSGKSYDSPWSIAKAIKSAPSGATVVFRGGTYRNVDIGFSKKLILQAHPYEKPLLKGSIVVQDWVADGSMWRKDGWTYSFPTNVGSEYINPNYPLAGYRDMVYVDGVSLMQVASKAQVVPGTFYVDSVNKQLYIGNNPADKIVEATALSKAFAMWTSSSSDSSGTVVRGLGFAHYADTAISVGVARVQLENNTFVWNGVQGVSFTSPDGIVRGNTFSYNGRKGLGAKSAHRMLLENNTISYNNVERFAKIWDAAGMKLIKTDGLILRNNLVEHNFANGIWVDVSCINATIVHNTSRNNEAMGIFFEISHKAIIAANIAYNNEAGIMVSNSSSARVYNNTLTRNNIDIYIKDTARNNTNPEEIAAGITWIARNNVFKNNILSNTNSGALFESSNCNNSQPSTAMIAAADYNAYYRTSSTQPKTVIKCSSLGYASVAAFKSATGYETNSLAIDNVATNPFFVDEANGNYSLKPDSPAIARGEPLPEDIASAIAVAPGVPVDMGALQKIVLVH